jgi:hypothetical protein
MEEVVNTTPAMLQHRPCNKAAICAVAACLCAWGCTPVAASAQEQAPQAPPATNPVAKAEAPPALQPPLAITLSPKPDPGHIDPDGVGPIYITGLLSGYGQVQSHYAATDHRWRADVDNAQAFINKPDGKLQFFVQLGYYSLPALGTPYVPAEDATPALYTPVPQAYLKFVPNEHFSVMIGKLPTLVGAESTFSYQNMNIQRGLLWNQENAVNRGVQANYTQGPLTLSLSVNDGFYSTHPSWISGLASYAIDKSSTITFVGAGNSRDTGVSSSRTPLFQNNQQIYNLIYTRTQGPWTIQPYLQYSHVPRLPERGINDSASTWGGAVLASYDFGSDATPAARRVPGFKLAGRLEYIDSSGAPSLLYGPGSRAWSFTLTPTYQYKNYFVRGELSYVGTGDTTPGAAFGANGNEHTQLRGVFELGMLF